MHTLNSQYGQTPLSWAARNGCKQLVKLLHANDSVDPDLKESRSGLTSLSRAAVNRHEAVVKLLLETGKAEVDSRDICGRTSL